MLCLVGVLGFGLLFLAFIIGFWIWLFALTFGFRFWVLVLLVGFVFCFGSSFYLCRLAPMSEIPRWVWSLATQGLAIEGTLLKRSKTSCARASTSASNSIIITTMQKFRVGGVVFRYTPICPFQAGHMPHPTNKTKTQSNNPRQNKTQFPNGTQL